MDLDDVAPYKKRSQKSTPPKAKHKHDFQPCVYEYTGKRLTQERGFVPAPKSALGSYCSICGKVGSQLEGDEWCRWEWRRAIGYAQFGRSVYTDKALRELDPDTRTLPTFRLDKDLWEQKFVDLKEKI